MKKSIVMGKFIGGLIIVLITLSLGCTKYKDGPFLTLRTNTQRFCRTWNIAEVKNTKTGELYKEGTPEKPAGNFFKPNNDNTFTANSSIPSYPSGIWDFFGGTKVRFSFTASGRNTVYSEYEILRNTASELWIKNDTLQVKYTSK